MRWVIVCEVPLDPKNGAGMRAILPYLSFLPPHSLTSLYLSGQKHYGMGRKGVNYVEVPCSNQPGFRVISVFFGTLYKIFRNLQGQNHFIIIPNTIRDVLMGLACRLTSRNTTVWVMDDFIETYAWKGRVFKKFCSLLFGVLYRTARQRIAVSESMGDYYLQIYGKESNYILGRTLKEIPQLRLRSHPQLHPQLQSKGSNKVFAGKEKLKLVYVGSFIPHYLGPVRIIKQILEKNALDIKLDLYGMHPPSTDWLLPDKITYRGSIPDEDLLPTLSLYDYGLIPYSFTTETSRMMGLSFPSKLIDYLGASLPALIIAPEGLSFLKTAKSKNIGAICSGFSSLSEDSIARAIQQSIHDISEVEATTYESWQRNAHEWAKESFLCDKEKIKQILGY